MAVIQLSEKTIRKETTELPLFFFFLQQLNSVVFNALIDKLYRFLLIILDYQTQYAC